MLLIKVYLLSNNKITKKNLSIKYQRMTINFWRSKRFLAVILRTQKSLIGHGNIKLIRKIKVNLLRQVTKLKTNQIQINGPNLNALTVCN